LDFERANTDGVGSVHIQDGKFIVDKYPKSISEILKDKVPFLSHMPHNGWTVAHLRAASHGCNSMENTHPFIVKDWAVVHNGIWGEYNIAKLALCTIVDFKGETDSEVAAHMINLVSPKVFAQEIEFGGVFLALNINGELHVMKTSGDLQLCSLQDKRIVIASEFPTGKYKRSWEGLVGWYVFGKRGRYKAHKAKKWGFDSDEDEGGDDLEEFVGKPYVPSYVPSSVFRGPRPGITIGGPNSSCYDQYNHKEKTLPPYRIPPQRIQPEPWYHSHD
jgi:hypothetical protein